MLKQTITLVSIFVAGRQKLSAINDNPNYRTPPELAATAATCNQATTKRLCDITYPLTASELLIFAKHSDRVLLGFFWCAMSPLIAKVNKTAPRGACSKKLGNCAVLENSATQYANPPSPRASRDAGWASIALSPSNYCHNYPRGPGLNQRPCRFAASGPCGQYIVYQQYRLAADGTDSSGGKRAADIGKPLSWTQAGLRQRVTIANQGPSHGQTKLTGHLFGQQFGIVDSSPQALGPEHRHRYYQIGVQTPQHLAPVKHQQMPQSRRQYPAGRLFHPGNGPVQQTIVPSQGYHFFEVKLVAPTQLATFFLVQDGRVDSPATRTETSGRTGQFFTTLGAD